MIFKRELQCNFSDCELERMKHGIVSGVDFKRHYVKLRFCLPSVAVMLTRPLVFFHFLNVNFLETQYCGEEKKKKKVQVEILRESVDIIFMQCLVFLFFFLLWFCFLEWYS